jgi:hypothetical protein
VIANGSADESAKAREILARGHPDSLDHHG